VLRFVSFWSIFAFLKGDANWFVAIVVLFLTFYVTVHDHAAIGAKEFPLFEAHSAYCEKGLHILSRRDLVRH